MKCKIINKPISPFMSFGNMPIANGFLSQEDFQNEFFFKMEVGFSEKISLFQLNNFPEPKKMFNDNYPFFTGSSSNMVSHFKDYANWIKQNYLKENSKLIEIGSNDGTFLTNFKNTDVDFVGFEPSSNVAQKARLKKIKTINKFFNSKNLDEVQHFKKSTDVISAANVICHIPDLNEMISAVEELLNDKGVFIFEEPYLGSMFKKTSFDQIYDEHIYIFSAHSIKKIFNLHNFDLIDTIPQITHGGSMRYVIGRRNKHDINANVKKVLADEQHLKLDKIESCIDFKKRCENLKNSINLKLQEFKKDGLKICGYAATSKSTTVLNYCKIGPEIIDFICDTTPEKIGKYSPGMHIPIKSLSYFQDNLPDIAYLFAWNHKNEIFSKEKDFNNSSNRKWFSHVAL